MEFFFVLTMKFLSGGNTHEESLAGIILANAGEGDTAENLFWRAYEIFKKNYKCESFGKILHWSIMPNRLPEA